MSDSNASSSSNTADIPVSPVAEGNGTPDAPKEKKLTAKELRMKAKAEEVSRRSKYFWICTIIFCSDRAPSFENVPIIYSLIWILDKDILYSGYTLSINK